MREKRRLPKNSFIFSSITPPNVEDAANDADSQGENLPSHAERKAFVHEVCSFQASTLLDIESV